MVGTLGLSIEEDEPPVEDSSLRRSIERGLSKLSADARGLNRLLLLEDADDDDPWC